MYQENLESFEDQSINADAALASQEYQRLIFNLSNGESYWFTSQHIDRISQTAVDKAIRQGDAVRVHQFAIRAGPKLLARLQAEVTHAQTSDENLTKTDSESVNERSIVDEGNEPLQDRSLSPRAFAAKWLRELLREPRWVEDILRLAQENGIAVSTLKRAKKSIGAKSVKIGGYYGGEDTRWLWRLG